MPPDDGRHRADHAYPPEQSWDVGRRGRSVVALLASAVMVCAAVHELVSDDIDPVLVTAWLIGPVAVTISALNQWRARVAVDGEGVHVSTMLRRRTYPWDEIPVVRPASASEGRANVQLVLDGGRVVNLPNVAGQFNVFRRWHDAVNARRGQTPGSGQSRRT